MANLLFVYGTLRGDSGHPMHAVLAAGARKIGSGSVKGSLFRIDWYPGLVLAEHDDSDERVRGDLWEVVDLPTLRVLDDYEGDDYERRDVAVDIDGGAVTPASAYVYIKATTDLQRVASGDWLAQG